VTTPPSAPSGLAQPRRGYRKGVGILLLDSSGRVFVARRTDTPEDAWQMPQGGIDDGETPYEAAVRELEEETGTDKVELLAESRRWLDYDLPPELKGQIWGGRFPGQTQKWFAFRFTGTDADINLNHHDPPEFSDWRWVDARALPDLIVPFKRQLYRDLLAEFAPLLGRPQAT